MKMFQSCPHALLFKKHLGFLSYTILHSYFVVNKERADDVKCSACYAVSFRQHACLQFVYFGCFRGRHIHEHAYSENHFLAVDIASGHIYCFVCKDYIHDEDYDNISRKQKEDAQLEGSTVFFEWEPSKREIQLLRKNRYATIKTDSFLGLRGLYNIGCTCYMNAVIQAVVHTTFLRDYFLAEMHTCVDDKSRCWGCIMSEITQEFHSGKKTPYSLHNLAYALWRDYPDQFGRAENAMQDSEEFYHVILDELHCCESKGNNLLSLDGNCRCFIHQIFSGFFQSEVACVSCGTSSKRSTAFWDVNLNFEQEHIAAIERSEKRLTKAQIRDGITKQPVPDKLYLESFIDSYIDKESIVSRCDTCGMDDRTIQNTFKKLPVVLCFHLKRKVMRNIYSDQTRKISTHVVFPEVLDMGPYVSAPDDPADKPNPEDTLYFLYAVVVHSGDSHGGHNYSYFRIHNFWFRCDDQTVEMVTLDDMLDCEGYLLYYQKAVIDFEPEEELQAPQN